MRRTGPYAGSGIKIPLAEVAGLEPGRVYCYEYTSLFKRPAGDFCVKLMKGTYIVSFDGCRYYQLP